tara:strand:- start:1281 stop:1769 length:489 start_codon:yes stop_codon:yes gene_type:complete
MATAAAEGFALAYGRLVHGAVQGAVGGALCGAIFGAMYEMLKPGSCAPSGGAAAELAAVVHNRPNLASCGTALEAAEAIWTRVEPRFRPYVSHMLQQVELAMALDRAPVGGLALRQASAALNEARRTAEFLEEHGGGAAGLGDAFAALVEICDNTVHNLCLE